MAKDTAPKEEWDRSTHGEPPAGREDNYEVVDSAEDDGS